MKLLFTSLAMLFLSYNEMCIHKEKELNALKVKFDEHIKTVKYGYVKNFIYECITNLDETDINVPYSVAIAQACLETGYGKSTSGANGNNLFGIKDFKNGTQHLTPEVINGKRIIIKQPFRNFSDKSEAFIFYGEKLNGDRYNISKQLDYDTAINNLVKGGYATAPNYGKCLRSIINRYKLDILDELQKIK